MIKESLESILNLEKELLDEQKKVQTEQENILYNLQKSHETELSQLENELKQNYLDFLKSYEQEKENALASFIESKKREIQKYKIEESTQKKYLEMLHREILSQLAGK